MGICTNGYLGTNFSFHMKPTFSTLLAPVSEKQVKYN